MALVEFFERKAKLEDDPYFETRERDERFIRQIIREVEKALDKVLPVYLAGFMSAYPARRKATMIQPNL